VTPALAALVAITLLRLVVAAMVPLSPDEAYYWIWSRALAPGYLDHPPAVALMIRLGTSLAQATPLGVRLLGPLAAAAGTLLVARAAEDLFPGRRAGVTSALLLNATLVLGAGSVMMTPDVPLLLFWTAGLAGAARWLATRDGRWWLAIGLACGAALASKYTAILLPLGLGLWLLWVPALRLVLRSPWPWAGAAAGAAVFMPVLAWNSANGWISFAKQGARAGSWNPARALQFLGELLGGQIALATPVVFAMCVAGTLAALRHAVRDRDPRWSLLACLLAPPVLIFIQHALGDRVQGNWPAIVYPAAVIAASALVGPVWRRLLVPAVATGAAITLLVYVQAIAMPFRVTGIVDPVALRLAGWGGFADRVEAIRRADEALFVAADNYGIAAELAWHLPSGVPVIGVDPRWEVFDLPGGEGAIAGRRGILVRSRRRGGDIDMRPWAELVEIRQVTRGVPGVTAEAFALYDVFGRPSAAASVVLPSRE